MVHMPQRRGLVPVKAVQQYSVSLDSFRDLLGLVSWCHATKAVTLFSLVFVNVGARDTGRALFAFVRPVWSGL